jgi:mitochondrial fission protein ELM1
MNVLILRDDRPGHFNQAEGLALALSRRLTVAVERLSVRPRPPLRGHALRWLARAGMSPRALLRLAHGLDPERVPRPDLVVSAGSDTLVANALLARHYGAANVFIGSLRGMPAAAFSAVLTIYPSLADRDRVILAMKPTPVDPDRLPPPRAIGTPADLAGASIALLVGGPTPTHLWSDADWRALAGLALSSARRFGARLRVTTSPRTPAAATAAFAALSGDPNVATLSFYGAADAPPLDHFFSADVILVSDDSATMAFEAVSARRPVVTLGPRERRPARDDEAFRSLEAAGLIRRLTALEARPESLAAAIAAVKPLAGHPMDMLLDRLAGPLGRCGIDVTPAGR